MTNNRIEVSEIGTQFSKSNYATTYYLGRTPKDMHIKLRTKQDLGALTPSFFNLRNS